MSVFKQLHNLEKNIRDYNLRDLPDRRRNRRNSDQQNESTDTDNNEDDSSSNISSEEFEEQTDEHYDSDLDLIMAEAVITNAARFCGNIATKDHEKRRLEGYTVYQWLTDADSRITSKGITEDHRKIKEALLLVSNEHGDAHNVLKSQMFTKITTYEDFKKHCIALWQPEDYKDVFYNLLQLSRVRLKDSHGEFMAELDSVIDRLVQDVRDNDNIKKITTTDVPGKQFVEIETLIKYISYGTIYDQVSEELKRAFKKVELNPAELNLTLLSKLKETAGKEAIRKREEFAAVTQHKSPQGEGNRGNQQNNNKAPMMQSNKQHNSYGKQGKSYNPKGFYNQQSGFGKQQGYKNVGWQQNKGYNAQGAKPKGCRNCGKNNHNTRDCIQCQYCHKFGHLFADCYHRKWNGNGNNPQSAQQGQGNNQGHNKS